MSDKQERVVSIVSIVPFPLMEFKPGIYPGNFEIPASKNNIPEVLHVGSSIYWVEIDVDRSILVKCPPEDVARAVVDDYVTSNLAYNQDNECVPGVTWLPGRLTSEDVQIKYANELDILIRKQRNWFLELVKIADDDWEKTQQHKTISDMQRYAAKALNLERPWIIIPKIEGNNFQKCPACASMVAKEAIVCQQCKCILDKKKYDLMQFA